METQVVVNKFYPEEFRKKSDSEKYLSKGTCEVHLLLGPVEMDCFKKTPSRNRLFRIHSLSKSSLFKNAHKATHAKASQAKLLKILRW